MIYLKINNAMMNTKMHTVRATFWAMLGIAILFINQALIRPSPLLQGSTATPATQTGTLASETRTEDEAGSTDEIMIVAVVIVLIVIIPILLKRRTWENGKRIRTAPPS
jgi:hypothetical protein